LRIRTVTLTLAVGIALVVSACTSSSKHSAAPSQSPSGSAASKSGFPPGPDPCRLLTAREIRTATKVRMTKVSGSASTCSYENSATTDRVSITTAKMPSATAARQAVTGTAGTVKEKVQHLHGLGDTAVAYLTTTKSRSIATCLFAKNMNFVFVLAGSPDAKGLMHEVTALAQTAARRI
jgi:hypothetical protein